MTDLATRPGSGTEQLTAIVDSFIQLVRGAETTQNKTESILKAILTAAGYEVISIVPQFPRIVSPGVDDSWPNPPYLVTESNGSDTGAGAWLKEAWEYATYPRVAHEKITEMVHRTNNSTTYSL